MNSSKADWRYAHRFARQVRREFNIVRLEPARDGWRKFYSAARLLSFLGEKPDLPRKDLLALAYSSVGQFGIGRAIPGITMTNITLHVESDESFNVWDDVVTLLNALGLVQAVGDVDVDATYFRNVWEVEFAVEGKLSQKTVELYFRSVAVGNTMIKGAYVS